jgi:4-hydroxybenzoate polyprenyltransferase/sulfatase maturation enzyme AslB (radical SAM superfamily)
LNQLKLIRISDWWNYLVPFFLGILYISAYIFTVDTGATFIYAGLFLIIIIGTASFGYLLNDFTDREDDRKAGKKNQSALHSSLTLLVILVFSLVLALSAGFLLPRFYQNTILYFALLILFLIYSVNPLRLKRFPVTGIIIDTLYNCTFMSLVIINTVYLSSTAGITIDDFVWFVIVLWTFMKGSRGILLHQLMDRSSDKKSGVKTFVIWFSAGKSLRILTRIMLPVETVCVAFLVILLSGYVPGFYLILISFLVYFLSKPNTWKLQKITFRKFRFKLFFGINDFYEVWVPLSLLVYLSVRDTGFLFLLALHSLFFYKGIIRSFKDVLDTVTGGLGAFYPFVIPAYNLSFHLRGAIRERSYRKIWKYLQIKIRKFVNNTWFSFRKSVIFSSGSSISRELFEAYNFSRTRGAMKLLCKAPFTSLYFASNGKITSCCFNREHLFGVYPSLDPLSAWHGKENQALRTAVSNNDLGLGCFQCKHLIESRNFDAVGARFYDKFPAKSRYPVLLEFELSNSCNLECIMCNEKYSSRIAVKRTKPAHEERIYDDLFIRSLDEFIPHLKEAKFLGGEPFFIEVYYRIWERIIAINPSCIIDVQTNATVLNDRVKSLLSRGNFQIGVSIDSLQKEEYEKIRKGADFAIVMKNIEYFGSYSRKKGTQLHISFCPMRSNWTEIPEIIGYSDRLGAFVYFNTVLEPNELALWSLPLTELKNVITCLENHRLQRHGFISGRNKKHFHSFLDQLRSWYLASLKRENEWARIAQMDVDFLKNAFLLRIREHFRMRIRSGEDTITDPDIISRKVSGVFDRFPESTTLKKGLLNMNTLFPKMISDETILGDEEELYLKMVSWLKEVEVNENPLNFNIFLSFHQKDGGADA